MAHSLRIRAYTRHILYTGCLLNKIELQCLLVSYRFPSYRRLHIVSINIC